jgi:hypothetical protein
MKRLRAFWRRRNASEAENASAQNKITITDGLGRLLAAIQAMVMPEAIWQMPYLNNGADATDAAVTVGQKDVESAAIDDLTRNPIMPNQMTVVAHAKELLELIGKRAYAILAALKAETLTEGFVPSTPAKGWKATSLRTKVLLFVAFVLEAVFGAVMAERLAGSHDYISWAIGLAIAALLTASSLSIAHAIHTHQIGFLRGKGAWVALGVSVLAIAFLTVYSLGLGGWAKALPIGGATMHGGTTPGATPGNTGAAMNWALTLIYGALLLFLLASVVCSHLIDLYREELARVDKDVAAKKAVLSPDAQKLRAIQLLSHCIVLAEQAKHRAQGLVHAYVGGVRRTLTPALNSRWNTDSLENLNLPDPSWLPKINAEIEKLRQEVGEDLPDNGPPRPSLALVRP